MIAPMKAKLKWISLTIVVVCLGTRLQADQTNESDDSIIAKAGRGMPMPNTTWAQLFRRPRSSTKFS